MRMLLAYYPTLVTQEPAVTITQKKDRNSTERLHHLCLKMESRCSVTFLFDT